MENRKTRILFVRNKHDEECREEICKIINRVVNHVPDLITYSQDETEKAALHTDQVFQQNITQIDYAVVMGGDGTMTYTSRMFPNRTTPPILGIAKGNAPIMYNFGFKHFEDQKLTQQLVKQIVSRSVKYEKCPRLTVKKVNLQTKQFSVYKDLGMSQIVIHRGKSTHCIKIQILIDNVLLTTSYGDGIIFATPYGSLAYALNSNGPILSNQTNCITMVPICPLSLSFRPICLPNTSIIKIRLSDKSRCNPVINMDGKSTGIELAKGQQIQISTSQHFVNMVNCINQHSSQNWIYKLKEVLKWGNQYTP